MGIDPASIALMSLVAGVASTGMSAAGSYESGQATKANDQYQAAVAANNALIAKQNAAWDIQAGETAATNQGLKTRAQIGTEKASQGAAGIDVNSGSAAKVRAGTESMGMLDAMTIRSNAAKQAYSAQVQATNETAQSQLDTAAGKQAGDLMKKALPDGGKCMGYVGLPGAGGACRVWRERAADGGADRRPGA